MDFDERLKEAISRGQRQHAAKTLNEAREAVSEEELRRLHSQYRLELSEHIEQAVRAAARPFPGLSLRIAVGRSWVGRGDQS